MTIKISEEQEQIIFSSWLSLKRIRHHHSPNGKRRDACQGAKLKKMGTQKGFPDIFIPLPSHIHHGLFIEMKSDKGRPTKEQIEWIDYLNNADYLAVICRSCEDAIRVVEDYLLFSSI